MPDFDAIVQTAAHLPPQIPEWKLDFLLGKIETHATSIAPTLIFSQNRRQAYIVYGLNIFALDVHTGDILWQYHVDEPVWASYLIKGEDLVLHLELSIIYLNVKGKLQWHFDHSEVITQVVVQNRSSQSSLGRVPLWQMLFSRQCVAV